MRVLYVAFADLGVPRAWTIHVLSTCRELRALGHEVHLVTPAPSAQVPDPGFAWRRLRVPRAARLGIAAFHAAVWRGLLRWTREAEADLVYVREVPFAWWLPGRAHAAGCPCVVEVNGIVQDETPDASWIRRRTFAAAERRQLRRADGLVAVTEEVRDRMREIHPGLAAIDVVPNGVDLERFDRVSRCEARRELGLDDGPWIGFVGGLFEYRALDRLVEAMPIVRHTFPGAGLMLVGDGPMRARLERAGDGRVRLVGDVPPDRVPLHLAAMDVCVVLSTIAAGRSIKVLEYMAARRPILASSGGGVRNLVEGTGAGILVDPRDPGSIARGIVSLLSDPGRAERMAEGGRTAVGTRFTWRHSAERLAEVLERINTRWRERGRRD